MQHIGLLGLTASPSTLVLADSHSLGTGSWTLGARLRQALLSLSSLPLGTCRHFPLALRWRSIGVDAAIASLGVVLWVRRYNGPLASCAGVLHCLAARMMQPALLWHVARHAQASWIFSREHDGNRGGPTRERTRFPISLAPARKERAHIHGMARWRSQAASRLP